MGFPFANKTFSIQRKTVTTNAAGNPVIGSPTVVATGVSVMLRDLNGQLVNEQTGQVIIGMYRGAAAVNSGIMNGDTLLDEAENDSKGNPIQYRVEQASILATYMKLHLKRLQVGS